MPVQELGNKSTYLSLGLMSGTSCDGIDLALIETDGQDYIKTLESMAIAYPLGFRSRLLRLISGGYSEHLAVEKELTERHAEAVKVFCAKFGIKPDIIGFHGQTVTHKPEQQITWQIGNVPLLCYLTNIDVVGDFRRTDVASGGQGAPLVPVFLKALAGNISKPVMFLNIGGVANPCFIDENQMLAFDCGPGNAIIDDLCQHFYNETYDHDGTKARSGKPDEEVLRKLLSHGFFELAPPKSLDRNTFDTEVFYGMAPTDALATATEFTALGIAKCLRFTSQPNEIIVSGGGSKNTFLMERLQALLPDIQIKKAEHYGLSSDMLEAQAFAYLAVRSVRGLPITFPQTTGCPYPMSGGVLCKAGQIL